MGKGHADPASPTAPKGTGGSPAPGLSLQLRVRSLRGLESLPRLLPPPRGQPWRGASRGREGTEDFVPRASAASDKPSPGGGSWGSRSPGAGT